MAIDIGRLCVKLAGRDAGRECLIIDALDNNFVIVDGNTRRKRVNVDHLEFLQKKADVKKGASHEEVIKALEGLGVKVEKKAAPKVKKEVKPIKETKAKKSAKK